MQVWKRESINVDAASDMLNNYSHVRALSAAAHFIQVKTLIDLCSDGNILYIWTFMRCLKVFM